MPARHHKPQQTWRAGLLLGLLLSLPAAAVELDLHVVALPVPGFILPADQPLLGLEQWQLAGVFHSSQALRSSALISVNGRAPQAVQVGEVLAQGIQLQAVYPDSVRLRRGNSSASLHLQQAVGASVTDSVQLTIQPLAVDTPSAECQQFIQSQVPHEELLALGICAPAAH
jgi:hypothetical protein